MQNSCKVLNEVNIFPLQQMTVSTLIVTPCTKCTGKGIYGVGIIYGRGWQLCGLLGYFINWSTSSHTTNFLFPPKPLWFLVFAVLSPPPIINEHSLIG